MNINSLDFNSLSKVSSDKSNTHKTIHKDDERKSGSFSSMLSTKKSTLDLKDAKESLSTQKKKDISSKKKETLEKPEKHEYKKRVAKGKEKSIEKVKEEDVSSEEVNLEKVSEERNFMSWLTEFLQQLELSVDVKDKLKAALMPLMLNHKDAKNLQYASVRDIMGLLTKVEGEAQFKNLGSEISELLSSIQGNLEGAIPKGNSFKEAIIQSINSQLSKDAKEVNPTEIKNIFSQGNLTQSNKESKENTPMQQEDFFLQKFIDGEKNDSKIDRLGSFINAFQDNRHNLVKVEQVKAPSFVFKGTFNEDIIKAIKFMDTNGIKDLSLKIYPKELGEVFISVTMEQGKLKALIKATNKEAMDMLNLGLRDISDKLNMNDVKIQSVDISLYNEDTTYFSKEGQSGQEGFNHFNGRNSKKANGLIEEEITTQDVVTDSAVNLLI